MIGNAGTESRGYIGVFQAFFHLMVGIRNGGIVKITANDASLRLLGGDMLLHLLYLLRPNPVSSSQTGADVGRYCFQLHRIGVLNKITVEFFIFRLNAVRLQMYIGNRIALPVDIDGVDRRPVVGRCKHYLMRLLNRIF